MIACSLPGHGCLLAETLCLNIDNRGMVNETVDRRHRHHCIGKNLVPLTEGLIGRHQQAFPLVAVSNQLEEDRGFHLRFFDISQIVDNQQVKPVEFAQEIRQHQLGFGLLQVLHQDCGRIKAHPLFPLHHRPAQSGRDVRLPDAGRPEDQAGLGPLNPTGILSEVHQGRGVELRTMVEIEAGQALARGQFGFRQEPLDAILQPAVRFELTQGAQELAVGPLLLGGSLLQILPVAEHVGETELLE